MNSNPPIRSRAAEEGSFEIPWWGIPLVLIVLYVCLFSGLGAIGLVGPDEPRYAAIARAMAETHDWVTPRLWGTPWFEKPVLYYWTAGIAMRIFGVSEFAARLPSALAGLLAVIAVAWTALRSYGLGAAWYSLLMLPTSVAMIGFSRAAGPDMPFAALLTAAMAVAVEMLQKERPGAILRIAFGFFLGAAVLAKGPAAVILAGGATLLWAAITRQWRATFRFLHSLVIAAFCLTALPWYAVCAIRNPDFLNVFIWQHNFERYLTPVFQHPQPFWFFSLIVILGTLPWFPWLCSGLAIEISGLRSAKVFSSPGIFLASWAAFPLIFFSLSQSKLPGYILPAVPPIVLLIVRTFLRQIEQESKIAVATMATIGLIVPLLLWTGSSKVGHLFAFPENFGPFLPNPIQVIRMALGVAVLGAAFVIGFSISGRWNLATCALACTISILLLAADRWMLPEMDTSITARATASWSVASRSLVIKYPNVLWLPPTFSFELNSLRAKDVRVYRLPRAYEYGLDYYYDSRLIEWSQGQTGAKVVFCSKDSAKSIQRNSDGWAAAAVTSDDGIYAVILQPSRSSF